MGKLIALLAASLIAGCSSTYQNLGIVPDHGPELCREERPQFHSNFNYVYQDPRRPCLEIRDTDGIRWVGLTIFKIDSKERTSVFSQVYNVPKNPVSCMIQVPELAEGRYYATATVVDGNGTVRNLNAEFLSTQAGYMR